jgi:CHASE3 domain
MAWPAALSLLLVGVALVLRAWDKPRHWLLPALGGVVLAFGILPILHYASIWVLPAGGPTYRNFAVPTAFSFLLFALIILRGRRSPASTAQSFIVTALILLGAIGLQSALSNTEMIAANHGVVRTYQVRGEMDTFISEIARMESSARAFALTGLESFATRYEYHRDEVSRLLRELEPDVADNPGQRERLARLGDLAKQKFSQSGTLLQIRRTQGVTAAADYLAG